ncbi:hypothetical protein K488DRAFT_78503 [Vararia minispora EC-137]|uniref:Uncharacterized protein n=1 Tax=Vararia minispora EC-137 TaxID=1314806 RepID=A0ACB8QL53_9AGAM|nr:hypothetical protein K488DRAFT_78503 [Vararia minispora EC-137]
MLDNEYQHMNEIFPGLWVGDLLSTKDLDSLRAHNIHSILSAMRGKIAIHETFLRHQILLDDTEDADILQHLVPAITFIDAELRKGRGVLVHCQAGMSRSAAVAAAYVMYHKNVDAQTALAIIREARPSAQPNEGFISQLEIFHQASFKVSKRDKATRMFYLERAVEEVLNGDGSLETNMFAKFPRTPSDSVPATPGGPRRRIRCKMCRTELASREHMLDHGQLGPPTPAVALSPAISRRSSSSAAMRRPSQPRSRQNSTGRRPSIEGGVFAGLAASLTMSALETDDEDDATKSKPPSKPSSRPPSRRPSTVGNRSPRASAGSPRHSESRQRRPSIPGLTALSSLSMSMSAIDDSDDDDVPPPKSAPANGNAVPFKAQPPAAGSISATVPENAQSNVNGAMPVNAPPPPASSTTTTTSGLQSPSDLAAQLYANPKLAALRGPMGMGMMPILTSNVRPDKASVSPPILANPKCSGYFVEPMEWMSFFLEDGQLAGKIICPNKKCGAKLGNYDWAGMCCGCKEWAVPGFCINRSKVDEIV